MLRRGKKTVGQVFIETPPEATGQQMSTSNASFAILAPISAVPTARLTVTFTASVTPLPKSCVRARFQQLRWRNIRGIAAGEGQRPISQTATDRPPPSN